MTQQGLQLHGLIMAGTDMPPDAPPHWPLPCGPLTALVSEVADVTGFAGQSPDTLARIAMQHHLILSAYCQAVAVLPFRFGAFFRSAKAIETAIRQQQASYVSALCDLDNLREYTLRLSRVARPPDQTARPAANGRAHLRARLQTRQHRDSAARRRQAFARDMLAAITAGATKVQALSTTKAEDVARYALLLPITAVPAVAALISARADAARAMGLSLDLQGPGPPYSYDLTSATTPTEVRHAS